MKLALGTAQFGSAYGVANRSGRVSEIDVARILERAWSAGIDTLDTAIAYGGAEGILGSIGVGQWRVISKIPAIPDPCADVEGWMESQVQQSLERLRTEALDGLLLHEPDQLLGPSGDRIYTALQRLRVEGLVRRIGVSVYDPEELSRLWPRYGFDVIQSPFNVLDRRLDTSGMLDRLHSTSVDVDVRSIFLQGILLMSPSDRPERFARFEESWRAWDGWLAHNGLSAIQGALALIRHDGRIHRVVVGVDSIEQLDEILAAAAGPFLPVPRVLSGAVDLIDPRRWMST